MPVLADAYQLDSKLDLSTIDSPSRRGIGWRLPAGLAQTLLDEMVKALDPDPLAAALERCARRSTWPAAARAGRGVPTVDAQLYQLMWKQDGALAHLPEVVADLQAIVSVTG